MEDSNIIHKIEGRLRNGQDTWVEVLELKNITLCDVVNRISPSYANNPMYEYRVITTEIKSLDWLFNYFK